MKKVRIFYVLFVVFFFIAAISFADQIDDLINQLKDSDPLVQCQAIEQLGQLKDKRAVDPLIALLSASPVSELKMTAPSQSQSPAATDPATEKVEKAKRACAGGDKHTPPSASANPATLKQLIAKMRTSQSFMDKAQAAEDLGKTKDKRAVDPLLAMLKEEDFGQLHIKVIEALGEIGDPKAVPALLNYLPTETSSAELLKMKMPDVPKLPGTPRDHNPFISEAAVKALVKIGDTRAAQPLYKAILSSPFMKDNGIEALVQLGDSEAVKYLNMLTKSEDYFLKEDAQKAIDNLGPNHGLDPLLDLLKDPDSKVRALAVSALTEIGDPAVQIDMQKVMAGLNEQDRKYMEQQQTQNQIEQSTADYSSALKTNIRITAIEALEQMTDPRSVRALLAALQDPDEAVCRAAGKALAAYKTKMVIRPIEMTLNSNDEQAVSQALRDLGWIGTNYAVELIARYIDNFSMGQQAVAALGHTDNPAAVAWLEKALQSPFLRYEAIDALAHIHHPNAVKSLVAMLSSNDFFVQEKIVDAISKTNDPVVIEPLMGLLKKNNPDLQNKVVRILGRFRDSRIGSVLAEYLTDPLLKEQVLAILKEQNWQPQTVREKTRYYAATGAFDQCAALGPEAIDLLVEELKKNCSSDIAQALSEISDSKILPPLLDCVKSWRAGPEHIAALTKLGWKPTTLHEQVQTAIAMRNRKELLKLWQDPKVKEIFSETMDSDNPSAIFAMVSMSLYTKQEDMIEPMVYCLKKIINKPIGRQICDQTIRSLSGDPEEFKNFWKNPHVKDLFQSIMKSDNTNVILYVIDLAIKYRLDEMIDPMISYLNSITDRETGRRLCELYLNSQNKRLYENAKSWAESHQFRIVDFPVGPRSSEPWGQW